MKHCFWTVIVSLVWGRRREQEERKNRSENARSRKTLPSSKERTLNFVATLCKSEFQRLPDKNSFTIPQSLCFNTNRVLFFLSCVFHS